MPDFENPGVVTADDDGVVEEVAESEAAPKSPEVLQREGRIRAFALRAQSQFFSAVTQYDADGDERYRVSDQWTGDFAPVLGTFLHVCREALDELGLQDVSENDVVRIESREPAGNRIAMAAGHVSGEILDVFLNNHLIYSVTRDEDFPADIGADPKDIPKELRTEADAAFDRLEFERALSELLDARAS